MDERENSEIIPSDDDGPEPSVSLRAGSEDDGEDLLDNMEAYVYLSHTPGLHEILNCTLYSLPTHNQFPTRSLSPLAEITAPWNTWTPTNASA
jgi:hypothetical protein